LAINIISSELLLIENEDMIKLKNSQ